MNMLRSLFVLAALLLSAVSAEAANRFAVCSTTCTWDGASTAMWSTTSGGGTGASVPGSGDAVILDAATCVGGTTCTITVNTTVTVQSITMGACTASTTGCILNFAANDNAVTVQTFNGSGTGTRTLNMGDGLWTITAVAGNVWDLSTATNLTFNSNSSTLLFQGSSANTNQKVFATGGQTYNIVQINDPTGAGNQGPFSWTGSATVATLTLTAVRHLQFGGGFTTTITNAFSLNGTSATQILVNSQSPNSVATVSVGGAVTMSWVGIENITKTGAGSITATNSFNLGGNTSITITPPSGGGHIIGG